MNRGAVPALVAIVVPVRQVVRIAVAQDLQAVRITEALARQVDLVAIVVPVRQALRITVVQDPQVVRITVAPGQPLLRAVRVLYS